MKPILIFGASISAAAMAAGFAVLANQAMPARMAEAEVIRPANVAREVVAPARKEAPRSAARPAPATPVAPAATDAASADAAAPATATLDAALLDAGAAQATRMYLLPPSAAAADFGLATRPVPRPLRISDAAAALPMADPPRVPRLDPGAAARFDYIPLIGVYR